MRTATQKQKIKQIIKIPKIKQTYKPSVEAIYFNIKGIKPPKIKLQTGVVLRPILR